MFTKKILITLLVFGLGLIAFTAINYQMNSDGLTTIKVRIKAPTPNVATQTPVASAPMGEADSGAMAFMETMGDSSMGDSSMTGSSAPSITGMSALAMGGENVNPALAEQVALQMMALQANPQDINTLADLALLFYQAGDFMALESFVARGNAIDPNFPKVKILVYLTENQLHDPILAIQALEEKVTENTNAEELALLAYLYAYLLKDQDKAADYLLKAQSLSADILPF